MKLAPVILAAAMLAGCAGPTVEPGAVSPGAVSITPAVIAKPTEQTATAGPQSTGITGSGNKPVTIGSVNLGDGTAVYAMIALAAAAAWYWHGKRRYKRRWRVASRPPRTNAAKVE